MIRRSGGRVANWRATARAWCRLPLLTVARDDDSATGRIPGRGLVGMSPSREPYPSSLPLAFRPVPPNRSGAKGRGEGYGPRTALRGDQAYLRTREGDCAEGTLTSGVRVGKVRSVTVRPGGY